VRDSTTVSGTPCSLKPWGALKNITKTYSRTFDLGLPVGSVRRSQKGRPVCRRNVMSADRRAGRVPPCGERHAASSCGTPKKHHENLFQNVRFGFSGGLRVGGGHKREGPVMGRRDVMSADRRAGRVPPCGERHAASSCGTPKKTARKPLPERSIWAFWRAPCRGGSRKGRPVMGR
jgi:hypothetical protein